MQGRCGTRAGAVSSAELWLILRLLPDNKPTGACLSSSGQPVLPIIQSSSVKPQEAPIQSIKQSQAASYLIIQYL